jgi:hypothetical protein
MACSGFALRLLARAESFDAREALIGDLLEEIACGRPRLWVYQQLIGLYGVAVFARVRKRARLTPRVVALGLGVVLLGGVSVAPVDSVLETWLGFYGVAGTLSLFAHMFSQTIDVRRPVTSVDAEESSAR